MKTKIVLAAAIALLSALPTMAQIAPLAPECVRGTLASYIALGSGGCMLNSILYHDFSYATPGATGITPAQIEVTPLQAAVAGLYPGLNFTAPWSVKAGQSEQSTIGFAAVPFPPTASGVLPSTATLTLDLEGPKVPGIIGSVTVTEKTAAASTSVPLEVYDICADACRVKLQDSVTLTGFEVLQTTITVALSGGTDGASLSGFATDYAY